MTGPSAGHEIRLDYDEALVMLGKAEAIIDEFREIEKPATSLRATMSAADDPASKAYNTLLTWNGQSGAFGHGSDHISLEHQYALTLYGRLRNSLGLTSDSDRQRGHDLNRSAGNDEVGFL